MSSRSTWMNTSDCPEVRTSLFFFFLSFFHIPPPRVDNCVHLCGLLTDHPESYHSFMYSNLFKHIDIKPANVHILDGNAEDLEKECEAYEAAIKVHAFQPLAAQSKIINRRSRRNRYFCW